jgi:hypothetical protein
MVPMSPYALFLRCLSEFACGSRWALQPCANSASSRRASMAAPGHIETFDESVGLPHTGHSESLAWGTSHLNR